MKWSTVFALTKTEQRVVIVVMVFLVAVTFAKRQREKPRPARPSIHSIPGEDLRSVPPKESPSLGDDDSN